MGNYIFYKSEPSKQLSTQFVSLNVTPGLKVPSSRLKTNKCLEQIQVLAKHNLIDEGALFPEANLLNVIDGHENGLIAAATEAFAKHYPLALKPQHFWITILQAIATHVDKEAKKVRSKWVAHEGKKHLNVSCDEFVLGSPTNDWASVVDGKPDSFAAQIENNLVPGLAEELVPAFSQTTSTENIAIQVTVMDACKNFFSYGMTTDCGFPSVVLEGTKNDWQILRQNAELLITTRCTDEFAQWWLPALLPLLEKFIQEYEKGANGAAGDERFWNSFVKIGGTFGSGAKSWFNGWINILFPIINNQKNEFMRAYSPTNDYVLEGLKQNSYFQSPNNIRGPDIAFFPKGLAEAPVSWNFHGESIELLFKSGFVGATQDADSRTIRPLIGWFIQKSQKSKK